MWISSVVEVADLEARLHAFSPRFTRPATPRASLVIHSAVFCLWLLLFANAFVGTGLAGWSAGIMYIGYDTFLLIFTFWQTLPLRHGPPAEQAKRCPTLAVVLAAYNEATVLEATVNALLAQSDPAEQIIITDDGSTDMTAAILVAAYGFVEPACGNISSSPAVPGLLWLRLPHAGKARALNMALPYVTTELLLTVDADTQLQPDAVAAMRNAFANRDGLVAATGVLAPRCDPSFSGRLFEFFQTYEYVRNFLGRYAWGQTNSLLLISGAFAAFRRDAVMRVGGFDPDCLVEDYELIHRLRRYGYDYGLNWHSAVIGAARAETSAPATALAFLRQRRRWFGGFLQTQFWYRDMVGAEKYSRLGQWMLPVKAVDTMQPIYGLLAFGLLIFYLLSGRWQIVLPVGGLIIGKIIIDLAFHLWSINLYRRWVGGTTKAKFGLAILAAIVEPFSFQLVRHLGASWGWVSFLTGSRSWGVQRRVTVQNTL